MFRNERCRSGFQPMADSPSAKTGKHNYIMSYFVYVLWSQRLRKRYVGYTDNIGKRIKEHNSGHNKFTKGGIPWELIHYEEFDTKIDAIKKEKFLKTGVGRKYLDQLLPNFRKGAGVV